MTAPSLSVVPEPEIADGSFAAPACEAAVLGIALIPAEEEHRDELLARATAEAFTDPVTRAIFRTIAARVEREAEVDGATVLEDLRAQGILSGPEGFDTIIGLQDAASRASFAANLQEVLDRRERRVRGEHARAALRDIEDSAVSIDELRDRDDARRAGLQAHLAVPHAPRLYDDVSIEDLPPIEYLIDGLLPKESLAVLFGPAESYKTFLALYIALCAATGFEFFGREVGGHGPVVYVSGEGRSGLGARVRVWKRHRHFHGRAGVRFLLDPVALARPDEVTAFLRLLDSLEQPPALVVFDTLARCMAGFDENSTGDMGAAVAGMDRIRGETGAATLALHHSPHDGKRERGSTALRGAADVSIGMRAEDGVVTVECAKMKDAPHFERMYLEPFEVGDSIVLVGAKSALHLRAGELTQSQLQALHSLHLLAPPHGLTASQWEEVSELQRRTFYAARKALVEGGYVDQDGEKRGALYTATHRGAELVGARCS
ncbi:MAG TPA: AAA family ATPase [Longimicrobiales bacterium]|nr:AAA family ATPase [Longimicrobiales bacterium]